MASNLAETPAPAVVTGREGSAGPHLLERRPVAVMPGLKRCTNALAPGSGVRYRVVLECLGRLSGYCRAQVTRLWSLAGSQGSGESNAIAPSILPFLQAPP
jgi:hypothetical protein